MEFDFIGSSSLYFNLLRYVFVHLVVRKRSFNVSCVLSSIVITPFGVERVGCGAGYLHKYPGFVVARFPTLPLVAKQRAAIFHCDTPWSPCCCELKDKPKYIQSFFILFFRNLHFMKVFTHFSIYKHDHSPESKKTDEIL